MLPGLELLTGADILISPLTEPILNWEKALDSKPRRMNLRKHTDAGLLIQRKTGRDLVNSIMDGHLTSYTLARMLEWSETPWLVIQGQYRRDPHGMCIVDDYTTNMRYTQLQGALESWQLRQGYYSILSSDGAFCEWIDRWHSRKLEHWKEDISLPPRKPQQIIAGGMNDPYPWRSVLACFPGVGKERATDIAKYCGSLWMSLMFLSSGSSLTLPGKPKGIGKTTIRNAQGFLGLPENTALYPCPTSGLDWLGMWEGYLRPEEELEVEKEE